MKIFNRKKTDKNSATIEKLDKTQLKQVVGGTDEDSTITETEDAARQGLKAVVGRKLAAK